MSLRDEILEQPEVAARFLGAASEPAADIADAIRASGVDHVAIAARGTSDHAAIYAQYVFGARHRLPVALAAPSLVTLYGVAPRFERSLVIGISQSGASPDVVELVRAARDQGAPTLAITNAPGSPLAAVAEHRLDLGAGEERSIAATKTYTAELLAIALLSVSLLDDAAGRMALADVPGAIGEAIALEPDVAAIARAQAADGPGLDRCVVLGRGYDYATAREWALKLKELARVLADPYSSADFQHGPLALVEAGLPVLAVVTGEAPRTDLVPLLARLRDELGARLLVLSDATEVRQLGAWSVPLPAYLPDWLRPIPSIVPAQLHALHTTLAAGLDPEAPRHLRKVTRTR